MHVLQYHQEEKSFLVISSYIQIIEEEYQRSKFGPLWFEPMYTKPDKVVFGRSLNPDIVYGEIYESEMQFMQSHIKLTI